MTYRDALSNLSNAVTMAGVDFAPNMVDDDDGSLSDEDIAVLREQFEGIAKLLLELRDQMREFAEQRAAAEGGQR
jgi:hypothetical protein